MKERLLVGIDLGGKFNRVQLTNASWERVEPNEGRACVYYGNGGNSGAALDRIARQARTDDAAPIALLGRSDSESAFRLRVLGRTPTGRGRVQVQFEARKRSHPADPLPLAASHPYRLPVFPALALDVAAIQRLERGRCPNGRTDDRGGRGAEGSAPGIRLAAPVPSPFASSTRFAYTLSRGGWHRLAVYDVQGCEVSVLAEGIRNAGSHTLRWDGCDQRGAKVPSGIYFLRLESAGDVEAQKVVIAR